MKGKPLYWRIRLKHPQTQAKWIRPMHQNERATVCYSVNRIFRIKNHCIGLPAILQIPQAIVWITEGEWCADHLI